MKTSPESIRIIQKLIKITQSELASTKKVGLLRDKSKEIRKILSSISNKDEQNLIVLDHTIYVLEDIIIGEPKVDAEDCDQNYENWMNIVLEYLKEFNKYGNCYINSCGEALLKTFGIKNLMNKGSNIKPIFFRGEHIYGRELIPRIVRTTGLRHCDSNLLEATKEELEHLRAFRWRYIRSNLKWYLQSILTGEKINWWSLMAHYDDRVGTRMIDITSSIFCALYFSCVDWDGSINTDVDGCLYFLWNNNWRPDTDRPHMSRGRIDDFRDQKQYSTNKYYSVHGSPDTLRFRESPDSNERLVYQDGYFIWQPKFGEPLDIGQHHKFRIHKDSKINILRELYSIGYTANRIVRGEKGKDSHRTICAQLDI
jgi:hypothetical protein